MEDRTDSFEVFPWNSNFETGVAIIDEQHQHLVMLLNKLADTLVHKDAVELNRVFDDLAAYAAYHFQTEESVWAPCFQDDEWQLAHERAHASFLPALQRLREEQGDMPLHDALQKVVKFLIRWLALHIIGSDRQMAGVLHHRQRGVPLEEAKRLSEQEARQAPQILIDAILGMYDQVSSRSLELMRERLERRAVEEKLSQTNRELERLATTDQLTGLSNRRHFDEVFEQELRRARRLGHYLSFIMFDIDHFKRLNDHYGHLQGDVVLKSVGQKLRELCRRPEDFAFRLGGEEFGLLIADPASLSGVDFAERLHAEVEALNIPNVNSDVADHLTISVGLVSKIPAAGDTVDAYMRAADVGLYQAKERGRNQVVVGSL